LGTFFAPVFCWSSHEIGEHLAGLFELLCVGAVADFEDRFREQRLALRRRLSAGMEEAKQGVTHRPNFGEKQLNRIGGALSRGSQCHLPPSHSESGFPARPVADSTSASSSRVSRMEMVFVRKLGLLSSPDVGLFACTVVVWKAFM
jgi:hypothetical protein